MVKKPTQAKLQSTQTGISYIIPVYNEEGAISSTIERLRTTLASLNRPFEIIVVDDGSRDGSAAAASSCKDVTVLRHPSNAGYGAALKTGITNAQHDWIGIVDADGTYEIEKIAELTTHMEEGFDMVVAVRTNISDHDGAFKRASRSIYTGVIKLLVNQYAQDPNSGLRMFKKSLALTFFPFLCNTFSFTTSMTVFSLGDAYFVKYVTSEYQVREGASKVKHFRDTLRTIQLIVQGVTFFNPVKLYLLLALTHIITVALPSFVLLSLDFINFGWIYFLTGTVSCFLAGIGALGDIFRISAMRPTTFHPSSFTSLEKK